MKIRPILFWTHLVVGLVAGLVIGALALTGALLACAKPVTAWMERDVRFVVPAAGQASLPTDELLKRFRSAYPDARASAVTFSSIAGSSPMLTVGRDETYYLNPYTGVVTPGAAGTRAFFRRVEAWHRTLVFSSQNRNVGRAITGVANVGFLLLVLSGLVLWWPRSWSPASLRISFWFKSKLSGRARDWNWHNVVGFWTAPILLVLTATALPLSYGWASDLIYRLTGTTAPAVNFPAPESPREPASNKVVAGAPLALDELVTRVQQSTPNWEQITYRMPGAPNGGPRNRDTRSETSTTPSPADRGGQAAYRTPGPAVFTVREAGAWPRTATATLTLDPFTGAVLRRDGFTNQNLGRRVRFWTRFLHTGEALGPAGSFLAAVACVGGLVLVITGFALAARRFSRRRLSTN